MHKQSIYIPLTVLKWDKLLTRTVEDLFLKSSGEYNINIHVSVVGNDKDYNKIVNDLSGLNVKITYTPLTIFTIGVGKNRKYAMSQYQNEDYVLQMDPHSIMDYNWDKYFVNTLSNAILLTNNNKTIITSYASRLEFLNGILGEPKTEFNPLYATFKFDKNLFGNNPDAPTWDNYTLNQEQMKKFGNDFAPSPKFNANCSFGNKEFAKNTGLYEDSIFWEEEITQSINLFDAGFCLVFPLNYLPINHYYDGEGSRAGISEILYEGMSSDSSKYSWNKYINDPLNYNKINKYFNYLKINLTNKIIENSMPTTYLNIKEKI